MDSSVKYTLFRGVLWNTIEKFSTRFATFAVGILLARLLSPDDYGLMGMIAIFISLSQMFIESGFGKALISKKDCCEDDFSTAFYTNVIVAVTLYIVLFVISPYVAEFYGQPILKLLLRVLSLNFVLGSFNIVQRARLMYNMEFKSLTKVNFIATICGGIIGVVCAYAKCGVWSIVAQTMSSTCITLCLFPIVSRWKPNMRFSMSSFRKLFSYGSKLLASSTLSVVMSNISTISIGKFFSVSDVGFYTRAVHFSELVNSTICDVAGTVTFPVLSKFQDSKNHLINLHKKTLFYTALVTLPIMLILCMLARPIILLLLTDKWEPSIFLFQILCLARMITPMTSLNLNILNAIGRSDLYLKLDFIKIPLTLIRLVITIPLGIKAIVLGDLIDTCICFFINSYYSKQILGYGAFQQIRDWRYIILSVILMVLCVLLVESVITNLWLQLIVGLIVGLASYMGCCFLFKQVNISEIKSLIKRS